MDDSLRALLLHRPDVLFDPEEVASAFDILEKEGKVRYFGVSNLVPMQIELLKKYVKQPLIINQVQLSLEQSQLIDQALYMNNKTMEFSIDRDGNALDNCRLNDITIQAWILRHPAKMQAIIGTMNPAHIKDACDASKVKLSHHDWYALYLKRSRP